MSAGTLRLARDVQLPLNAVTQTFAVLGKRGSGKTNTAGVLTEQLVKRGLPVVYIDPIGVTWGFRHSRDGKGPGIPIIILGGEHADVPLEETGGLVVADFVVEHRVSAVLDLGLFSKSAQRRFMVDFAERLYLKNRSALQIAIDECDTFVPQRIDHGGERLVGAVNDLVRKGRARGIGVTLISQRPALVNKDVLTQVETLIAHRMTGPHDRDAIERWIEHNGDDSGFLVLSSLQTLEDGEAWIWSPSWLRILKRTRINLRETFDSSATPKAGARAIAPKHAAEIDLAALRERFSAAIEKMKAEDPRELKKQLAEFKKQLAAKPAAAVAPKRVEVKVVSEAQLKRLEALESKIAAQSKALGEIAAAVRAAAAGTAPTAPVAPARPIPAAPAAPAAPKPSSSNAIVDGTLPAGERAVLICIAQYAQGATRAQIGITSGYKRPTRNAYIQRLAARDYIEVRGELVVATWAGLNALGSDYEPLPTGDALRAHWLARLPEGERKVLQVIADAHPDSIDRDSVGERTGYKRPTRNAYIQRLGARLLVATRPNGHVIASQELFS
jgi:uncharacterized protein